MANLPTLDEVRAGRTPVVLADDYRAEFTGPRLTAVPDHGKAHRAGRRFGVESLIHDREVREWLVEADALLSAADPAVQSSGREFLAGVRAALAVTA